MKIKDLAALIKANPKAVFTVDNDCWWMNREPSENNPYDGDSDDEDELNRFSQWDAENELCNDGDMDWEGENGYGSGPFYGGHILQALAKIVGVKVESV